MAIHPSDLGPTIMFIRQYFTLKCKARYGKSVICFISEKARDERAAELIHEGHGVVIGVRHG